MPTLDLTDPTTAATAAEMVAAFQCPGCVSGPDPDSCPHYSPGGNFDRSGDLACGGHYGGTTIGGVGTVYLGLPKGFCRPGTEHGHSDMRLKNNVRLWPNPESVPPWNHLNVAVWAMEDDGHLFVRTFAPRLGRHWIDVIRGGTLDLVPGAIDVAAFLSEID